MSITAREQLILNIVPHGRKLSFELVKRGRKHCRLVVRHGRREGDTAIHESRTATKLQIISELKEDLYDMVDCFQTGVASKRRLFYRSMQTVPPLTQRDLLSHKMIDRIIRDLRKRSKADTYTHP